MQELNEQFCAALHNYGEAVKAYANTQDTVDFTSMVHWQNELWRIAQSMK